MVEKHKNFFLRAREVERLRVRTLRVFMKRKEFHSFNIYVENRQGFVSFAKFICLGLKLKCHQRTRPFFNFMKVYNAVLEVHISFLVWILSIDIDR